MGKTCCVQKLFLTFRTIYVYNMFSPCSAKIRASDKDLPVQRQFFNLLHKIIQFSDIMRFSDNFWWRPKVSLNRDCTVLPFFPNC